MIEAASSLALVENAQIAELLHEVADLLESQDAIAPRVGAYRIAAHTVNQLQRPAREIYSAEGTEGLQKLPGIGQSLAHSIGQMKNTVGRQTANNFHSSCHASSTQRELRGFP